MTPVDFRDHILVPGLACLERFSGVGASHEARVLLLAIAGQESGWKSRLQVGGPARGFWQFERGGGVRGVLNHPATSHHAAALLAGLHLPADDFDVANALATNDNLATGFARLLLWTDPHPLPAIGDEAAGWDCYLRNWRPGKPRPVDWSANYAAAVAAFPP